MNKTRVSIIIATYNRAALLEKAVATVQAQTYRPLELIVVDDGSTDATPQLMRRLMASQQDTEQFRLRYIKQENQGPARARNRGVRASQGQAILFMDDDDLMDAQAIEHLVEALGDPARPALSYGAYSSATPEGLPVGALVGPPSPGTRPERLARMIEGSWFVLIHGYLFSRPALERIGPWDPSLSSQEDDAYLLLAALRHVAFRPAPGARVYYRDHDGIRRSQPDSDPSRCQDGQLQRLHANLAIRELAFSELARHAEQESFREAFHRWYQRLKRLYGPVLERVDLSSNRLVRWARSAGNRPEPSPTGTLPLVAQGAG